MRKPKRKDIVLSILRLIETRRPSKKLYGYFTRRQLVELQSYLLLRKHNSRDIYKAIKELRAYCQACTTPDMRELFNRIMRLSYERSAEI
jgi:hypothetical protein